MAAIDYDPQGKPTIRGIEAFCSLRNSQLPRPDETFQGILHGLDNAIKAECNTVSQGALSKCHGDWYEWILACIAWNFRLECDKNLIALLLPNKSLFDVSRLYSPSLAQYIDDLKQKVLETAGVQLITSNPDFVIVNLDGIQIDDSFNTPILEFTEATINQLQEAYRHFIGACSFENIAAYLSVKTSFRPDRRLQISHEGSLMKATYIHLQTREWIINPRGLKYYAAAAKVSNADRTALKTVATHSITNVQSLPQAAVDDVFEINTVEQAQTALNKILTV